MSAGASGAPVVWCDFGGVLTAPVAETLASFCARVSVPPPTLISAVTTVARRYGTDDIMEPLDTPLVGAAEWAAQVEQVLLDEHQVTANLGNFQADWFTGRPANTELINYLWELKRAGTFIGMLSNMVPAFEPYWPRIAPPSLFDALIFSYQVGVRKPDRRIFELAAARARARPEACILIDDLPQHCESARNIGWRAVSFQDKDDSLRQLRRLMES